MSAEAYGKQLLAEVEEETLDQLVKSLREANNPGPTRLGIEPLDIILNAFENPPATRQQEIYREAGLTDAIQRPIAQPKPPTVLEITSGIPCSGKTQLLYTIISLALLPASAYGVTLHGKSQAVVLFDLSNRLSILRLQDIMHGYISEHATKQDIPISSEDISILIQDSFMHLHIYKPYSTLSLLSTLAMLPSYLLSQPSEHFSSSRPFGLLCLSDLSTFLPQDRLHGEETAFAAQAAQPGSKVSSIDISANSYRALVESLRQIHTLFSPVIIATTYALSPPLRVLGQRAIKPHLPSVWTNFCTAPIVLERHRSTKVAPGISILEAASDREARERARETAKGQGWVNWWNAEEGWREEVKAAVGKIQPFNLDSLL